MNLRIWGGAVALGLTAAMCAPAPDQQGQVEVQQSPAEVHEKGGEDLTGPYEVVEDWPQPLPDHEGWTWGSTAGIFAETPDKIFILQRGELPALPPGTSQRAATTAEPRWEHCVLVVDGNGKLIDTWTQHDELFYRGHKILISPYDPDKHVWIISAGLAPASTEGNHQIFKFTNDGKELVMTLGEGSAGNDESRFSGPTDIAWLPDGTFFVTDGYINTRVVKFSKDGEYLMEWGEPGTGPGEFNLLHGIAIDDQRRVYVSDRSNRRVQIFDENGKYLDEWPNLRSPFHLYVTADQHLWVADGATHRILKYDLNGKLLDSWGTSGRFPGALGGVHQISVDQDGNLYLAEVNNGRAQKFRPRPGADHGRLVGQPLRFAATSSN